MFEMIPWGAWRLRGYAVWFSIEKKGERRSEVL